MAAARNHEQYIGPVTAGNLLKTRTPLLTGLDVTVKRQEIREVSPCRPDDGVLNSCHSVVCPQYFHKTFTLYERLFDVLKNDDTFYLQPDRLRHPLIFYWGHTVSALLSCGLKTVCSALARRSLS